MTPEEQAAARQFLISLAVLTGLSVESVRRILNSSAWSQAHMNFPWERFSESLRGFGDELAAAFSAAAQPVRSGVTLRMDLIDDKAVRWAETRSSRFITEIVDEQRAAIRAIIADSVRGNFDTDQAAARVSRVVGLTDRSARAVDNSFTQNYLAQINAGRTPQQAQQTAARVADAYRQRLLRARAQVIARTEIHAAQNAGRYAGWEDMISQGFASTRSRKQWVTYNPCSVCEPMDGEIVLWNENFSNGNDMPAAHPNCVCQAILLEEG